METLSFKPEELNEQFALKIAGIIASKAKEYEFEKFYIGCSYPKGFSQEQREKAKKGFQFTLNKKAGELIGKKLDFNERDFEIILDLNLGTISFNPKAVFLRGRYNKLSREIAQTYHYCFKCRGRGCKHCNGKGKISEESVEEIIAKYAVPEFSAEKMKFHGAGREDKDVLMLGNGRPFMIQLIGAKKSKADLRGMEKNINKNEKEKIQVHNLEFTQKKELNEIKHPSHEKVYSAIVECEKADGKRLMELEGKKIEVKQRTPVRVSKRRADKVRERKAELGKIEVKGPNSFKIEIKSDAGLYIKELISGDSKRTEPSISSLLKQQCKCTQLDVIEICG